MTLLCKLLGHKTKERCWKSWVRKDGDLLSMDNRYTEGAVHEEKCVRAGCGHREISTEAYQ